jgi:hypothetical protein
MAMCPIMADGGLRHPGREEAPRDEIGDCAFLATPAPNCEHFQEGFFRRSKTCV